MKITATGGTDVGCMVLFWPDTLPAGADEAVRQDPMLLMEQLRKDGKLIWFPCDSDGEYTVSLFVGEPIPDPLKAFCQDAEEYPRIAASGDAYFGGAESMFKEDATFRNKYPAMCERVTVPDGVYSGVVYQTDIPDTFAEQWVSDKAGPGSQRVERIQNRLSAIAMAAVLAAAVSFVALSGVLLMSIVVVTGVLVFAAVALSRSPAYRTMQTARLEFEREFPAYVVQMNRAEDNPPTPVLKEPL